MKRNTLKKGVPVAGMQMFARLTKVNEEKRQVTGILADESIDASGEVFDYDSSKPNFQKWSGDVAKASNGQSVGNLRAQHGRIVAGRLTDIVFDDVAKAIEITAEVVDDNEWHKVLKGCYTGFSVGGAYAKKWKDEALGKTRYTAKPVEASIVDMPCNPNSGFTVIKADGTESLMKFNVPEVKEVKVEEILAKALAFGDSKVLEGRDFSKAKELKKGLYSVCRLADLVDCLASIQRSTAWEAEDEGDGSQIPADLKAAVKALGEILCRMAEEEVAELFGDDDDQSLETSMKPEELQKSVQDAFVKAIASEDFTGVLAKALEGGVLAKALEKPMEEMKKSADEVKASVDALAKRTEKLEKSAAPGGPVVAVAKGTEVTGAVSSETKPVMVNGKEDAGATLLKSIHAQGGRPLI